MIRNHIRAPGITRQLYILSITVSLALAALASYAFVSLREVSLKAQVTETVRVPQLSAMASLELAVTRASLQLRHAMLARTPQERDESLNDIGIKRKLITELMTAYEARLDTEQGKAKFAQLPMLMDKFWKIAEVNIGFIQSGHREQAFAYLVDQTIPARNQVLQALETGVGVQGEALSVDIQTIQGAVQSTSTALLLLVVSIVVVLLAFAVRVATQLRRRVTRSQLAAERVRDGDLRATAQDDTDDEFSPLLIALSEMQASLSRVVSSVRQGSESVATASAEIAQGNTDLSMRTERQASALEETAASMEELGSTVRQNADSARLANELAQNASAVAVQGGEVVSQVVGTMKGINDSSRKIADIIGVIDSIAFQTNILALNAAVEAARAGEQGRGFAVVAAEVRNLASRSADAAKEIKTLIGDSVTRVDQGSVLVDQAGATMSQIVTAIKHVSDIVGKISTASAEQSAGVAQVGEAVSNMDQTTQQNAALVEEMAAAASSLKSQAQELVQAVAVFKVS